MATRMPITKPSWVRRPRPAGWSRRCFGAVREPAIFGRPPALHWPSGLRSSAPLIRTRSALL